MAEKNEQRYISIKDGHGNVLYEGKDNRQSHYPVLQRKPFWNFTAADMVKILGIALVGYQVYFGMKTDISFLKEAHAGQLNVNQKILDYMVGHDAYLAQITGKRFQGGVPLDPNFDGSTRKIGV